MYIYFFLLIHLYVYLHSIIDILKLYMFIYIYIDLSKYVCNHPEWIECGDFRTDPHVSEDF